jgi:hypothetical protein
MHAVSHLNHVLRAAMFERKCSDVTTEVRSGGKTCMKQGVGVCWNCALLSVLLECIIIRTETRSSSWQMCWTYILKDGKGWGMQAVPRHGDLEPDELVVGLNYNIHWHVTPAAEVMASYTQYEHYLQNKCLWAEVWLTETNQAYWMHLCPIHAWMTCKFILGIHK